MCILIGGLMLEDGFQLDEAAAPVLALKAYVERTDDVEFLRMHRPAVIALRDRLIG